ncbi:hypothetical protein GGI11_006839, partial [Coemansia sp. RSA 2049]
MESVKKTLGPDANISDQEIKESLWYYYFDEAATVAWLRRLTLSQLALRPSATSSPAPVLKNFSGRQIPAPKSTVLGSEKKADPDSTSSSTVGHQIHSRRAGLEMGGRQQPVMATLYGRPSPLACFMLDGIAKTIPSDASANTASVSIERELRSEIQPAQPPPAKTSTSGTGSKGSNVPTKDISRLKISSEKAQLLSSESESSKPTTPAGTPRKRINVVDEYSKNLKTREILNLVVVGHVDAGKSTLMGHLLYALGQVNERTIK